MSKHNSILFGVAASAVLSTLVSLASSASAGVLFKSIPYLTAAPVVNSWCSDCGGEGFRVFDTFTLPSNATLGAVLFDVQTDYPRGAPPWGPLNVGIFTTSGGLPDLSGQILNYTANFGASPADYQFSDTANDTSIVTFPASGTPLAGGTQYWISFYSVSTPSNLGVPGYSGGSGQMVLFNAFGSVFDPLGQSAGLSCYRSAQSPPSPPPGR
jgi:hypothetical protein